MRSPQNLANAPGPALNRRETDGTVLTREPAPRDQLPPQRPPERPPERDEKLDWSHFGVLPPHKEARRKRFLRAGRSGSWKERL